jgi:hypothetical protein
MKKILFSLSTIIIFFIFSCKKEEPKPDCEVNKYGTVTISNSSSNPYDVYIDGSYIMQLSGGTISTKIKVNEGNNRKFYAKQVSGYLLYPTEKTEYVNILRCSDYGWQIP